MDIKKIETKTTIVGNSVDGTPSISTKTELFEQRTLSIVGTPKAAVDLSSYGPHIFLEITVHEKGVKSLEFILPPNSCEFCYITVVLKSPDNTSSDVDAVKVSGFDVACCLMIKDFCYHIEKQYDNCGKVVDYFLPWEYDEDATPMFFLASDKDKTRLKAMVEAKIPEFKMS
jgi:hypothetical protein